MHGLVGQFLNIGDQPIEESPVVQRMVWQVYYSAVAGFLAGSYRSSKQAALQHIADNLHVHPRTKNQWYQYYKNRNYKVMSAFALGGIKTSAKIGTWCLAFSMDERLTSLALTQFVHKESKAIHWDSTIAGGLIGLIYGMQGHLYFFQACE